ncbi:MAG: hypothetical protein RL134_2529 [Actinomycetota bacterium]
MRFRDTFPPHPAFGHCLVNGQISQGPCVDLQISTDMFTRRRRAETLVLSAETIRSMAAHFGMVSEQVHLDQLALTEAYREENSALNEKVAALMATLQAFGLPEPKAVEEKPKPAKKAAAKKPVTE